MLIAKGAAGITDCDDSLGPYRGVQFIEGTSLATVTRMRKEVGSSQSAGICL